MSVALAQPSHAVADEDTLRFHRDTYVFDGLSLAYVLDEPYAERCLEGGVNGTNVTFLVEESWDEALRRIETLLARIDRNPLLRLCRTADELLAARDQGRLGVVLGTQGATFLDDKLWRLELLVRLGLRFLGLAYTTANGFGDGCGEKRDAGVSYLGEELIELANRLPLILDLSHCGHRTRAEAAALARAPVCTHSNADALRANGRNTRDDAVRAMVAKGGMIGVCGLPQSLADTTPTLDDLLDHIDYLTRLVGVAHVGIGMDYVEAFQEQATVTAPPSVVTWRTRRPDIFGPLAAFGRQSYPIGLEAVRKLPNLTQGLFDRGYTRPQAAAILGGNWLRCLRAFCG
ncbi:MAG: membrane dipeptidase [Alphaproteobacteria bacterium]|nr:membrane dipeptidase [Alphaproteobacteria bacterium]